MFHKRRRPLNYNTRDIIRYIFEEFLYGIKAAIIIIIIIIIQFIIKFKVINVICLWCCNYAFLLR